jgi:RNA polymerase sigma-70 factor (ECF subfamily)
MTRDSVDERQLVRELKGGSRKAFEALLDRCERRVYSLALRMLDDRSEAEDATQDVFLEVHRSLPKFRGDSRLDTWVHRIAVNVCLQRRRRRRLPTVELAEDAEFPATSEDPFRSAALGELRAALESAVSALPEGQREVVLLHGMQGLTYAEVAGVLECPIGTVKSRLSTAFRRLRGLLEGYVGGETGMPGAGVSSMEVVP